MSSRRKQAANDDVSLETTVPTDLSFSPDEISELYTTDDDRLRAERRSVQVGNAIKVTNSLIHSRRGFNGWQESQLTLRHGSYSAAENRRPKIAIRFELWTYCSAVKRHTNIATVVGASTWQSYLNCTISQTSQQRIFNCFGDVTKCQKVSLIFRGIATLFFCYFLFNIYVSKPIQMFLVLCWGC